MSGRLERYKLAKDNRLAGKFNGAPIFHKFPRLGKIVPTIPKGKQIMTLAGNGIGKSQSVIGITIMTIYNIIKTKGYKAHFYIALLEDPIELFEDRLFCHVLYDKYGISIDPMYLNSMRESILTDNVEKYFKDVDEIVEDVLKYCTVINSIYTATGLYMWLKTESTKLGEHHMKEHKFEYKNPDGSKFYEVKPIYSHYVPKDPELHNIVIVDNLNNLAEEFDKSLQRSLTVRDAMGKWARDYARLQICKHWNWTVWNIMQTALEYDKKEFTAFRGEQIIEKTEPTLNALGDNKIVSRDHHLILALYSPSRFGIKRYEGYNIERLGDAFRALIILKSNFSQSNVKLPLFFHGACSYYLELPIPEKLTDEKYNQITKLQTIQYE